VSYVLVVGSIIKILVLLKGIPYILPFGARTPPTHLFVPVSPVIVELSYVLVCGSIIKILVLSKGIPYIFPFGERTPPLHFRLPIIPLIVDVS